MQNYKNIKYTTRFSRFRLLLLQRHQSDFFHLYSHTARRNNYIQGKKGLTGRTKERYCFHSCWSIRYSTEYTKSCEAASE